MWKSYPSTSECDYLEVGSQVNIRSSGRDLIQMIVVFIKNENLDTETDRHRGKMM